MSIAAECGIFPLTEADGNVATSILAGEDGEVFCAVETVNAEGCVTLPVTSFNLITGEEYKKGQRISLEPYGYIFAKKQ
jgi:hypothetical protein